MPTSIGGVERQRLTAVEIDGVGTSTDRQPMRLLVDGVTRCGPRLDDTVRMGHGRRLCPMARPAAVGGATQRPMAEQQLRPTVG